LAMYRKVFISHSKDDPRLGFFHKLFSGLETKAVWMEFECIKPPAHESIKSFVNSSDALFVLLSDQLVDITRRHTANWVSFEIGLAANYRSQYVIPMLLQDRIDVYVFEPLEERIDFAIPYCTYYMQYCDSMDNLQFLRELIESAPNHNKGIQTFCPHNDCQVQFKLLTKTDRFPCPTCRREIQVDLNR
jgi:hypothetical protein